MILWASPRHITHRLATLPTPLTNEGSALSGDWDKDLVLMHGPASCYQALAARMKGTPWKKTLFFLEHAKSILAGKTVKGCSTVEELLNLCQKLETMYCEMREYGYRQIGRENMVTLALDRDGKLLLCDGEYRVAMAHHLSIETIPVHIALRHSLWTEICQTIHKHPRNSDGKLYSPIDHPDFMHMPSFSMGHSSVVLDNMLPTGKTMLDIGARWGYMTTLAERTGKTCVAIEKNEENLKLLHTLRKANNCSFTIEATDFLAMPHAELQHDTVLALGSLQHCLCTSQKFQALGESLKAMQMQELFLLAAPLASQPDSAHVQFSPDEFARYIVEHSCLDTYKTIDEFNGKTLFHITRKQNAHLYPQKSNNFSMVFLAFIEGTFPQIMNKVQGQFTGLKQNHPNCRCIVIGNGSDAVDTSVYDFDFVDLRNFPDGNNQRGPIAVEILKKVNPEIIYMRYPVASVHLEYITRHFPNILFEHQTMELEELENSNPGAFINELAFGATCMQRAQGGIGVTDEITHYQRWRVARTKSFRTMSNGIECSSHPLSAPPSPNGKLHALFVADFRYWHGLDRLVSGCTKSPEEADRLRFHLVGYGPALEECKLQIQQHGLEKIFRIHGHLPAEKIGPFADLCSIGIGVLAPGRKHLTQTTALKHREYVLRGLPFVYAGEDCDFTEHMPFCYNIPDDNSPVDIPGLLAFAQQSAKDDRLRLQAREFALTHLSWSAKMRTVVSLASEVLAQNMLKHT